MEPLYELVKVTSNKLNRERHSENKSGNMEWHVQINGGHIFQYTHNEFERCKASLQSKR